MITLCAWKNKNWISRKVCGNLHDKTEYVMHIRNLSQALNNRLDLKKIA